MIASNKGLHWGLAQRIERRLAQRIKRGLNKQSLEGLVPGSLRRPTIDTMTFHFGMLAPDASATTIHGGQAHSQDGESDGQSPGLMPTGGQRIPGKQDLQLERISFAFCMSLCLHEAKIKV